MSEEAEADPGKSELKKPPASLVEYVKGDAPAGIYVAAIDKREVRLPDDQERSDALQLVLAEPERLSRVVDLSRAVVDSRHDPRLRRVIHGWALDVLHTRDSLANWGRLGSENSEIELRQLIKRLRDARGNRVDRAAITEAEQILLIGLSVASARFDFSVVGALATIYDGFHPRKPAERTDNSLEGRVKRALARASVKTLDSYSLIYKLVSAALDELRIQFSKVSQESQNLRERNRSLQDDIARLSDDLARLRSEKESAAAEVVSAQRQLAGVKGGAAHEMIEERARIRRLLAQKLAPFATQASDALSVDPPVVQVVAQRLDLIKTEINKELEWLKQFSD